MKGAGEALVVVGLMIATIAVGTAGFVTWASTYYRAEAVRAAIRGDCEGALEASGHAGRIPHDVYRLCLEGMR